MPAQLGGFRRFLAVVALFSVVPAAPAHRHISATLARQIAEMKGDLSGFVPAAVARRLAARA